MPPLGVDGAITTTAPFNEAAGADPADALDLGGLERIAAAFNEAAGADPADALSTLRLHGHGAAAFNEAAGADPADAPSEIHKTIRILSVPSMRPRGQTPRMPPPDRGAEDVAFAVFNEAAGADPADATWRHPNDVHQSDLQ